MSRIVLYPYKMASESCNALAAALAEQGKKVLKVYPDRNFSPKRTDLIINWGSSVTPAWTPVGTFLNNVKSVNLAGDKLLAFNKLRQCVNIPNYTESQLTAQQWVNEGEVAVVRAVLRGHSGAGISLVGANIDQGDMTGIVPEAPLYTSYIKKAREYRVHIFNRKMIYWQQKMVRKDFPDEVNYQVRSHATGWIYATEAATPPSSSVVSLARHSVNTLGLTFGAVDVVWNSYKEMASVLEVNTAPGLSGSTINKYRDAVLEML